MVEKPAAGLRNTTKDRASRGANLRTFSFISPSIIVLRSACILPLQNLDRRRHVPFDPDVLETETDSTFKSIGHPTHDTCQPRRQVTGLKLTHHPHHRVGSYALSQHSALEPLPNNALHRFGGYTTWQPWHPSHLPTKRSSCGLSHSLPLSELSMPSFCRKHTLI